MEESYERAAGIIKESKCLIALTGAGISVESGIPDFRSPGGLWERFDPMEYANINSFMNNPRKVWDMFFSMKDIIGNAKPNPAHFALARFEEMGICKAVITQNVDNLHQDAGTQNVIEFHGNFSRLECLNCGSSFRRDEFELIDMPPECRNCGNILKPSVIFFGEMIPQNALIESHRFAESTDVVMVIGTSALVYPAMNIPYIAKRVGANIIEMNIEHTSLTESITDVFIEGEIGTTLATLQSHIERLILH
ncbi:MAG: NAD-dependent deacylase [Spirochaetota bacterium]|nr:NAD-dependent deacylase [Spirochaetota bacterium]